MSEPKQHPQSSFARRRFSPVQKSTFFDRHYRAIHHVGLVVGLSLFFGPFVYKFVTRPSFEDVVFPANKPIPDYAAIEKALDKWRW